MVFDSTGDVSGSLSSVQMALRPVKLKCSSPEPDQRDGLFVVVSFDVGDSGVVIDCAMQIGVADTGPLGLGIQRDQDPAPT